MEKKRKKDKLRFTRKMQKKLAVLFIFIMLALIGLVGRLVYIYRSDGEKYSKQVLAHQNYDSRSIVAKRGDIVDRKGTVLATSEEVYNVIVDAKVMTTSLKGECVEPTIQALVKCFGAEESKIREFITTNSTSQYYVLLKKVPYEQMQSFQDLVNQVDDSGKKVNPNIKGVWFEKEYTRKYNYGSLACDLLGFTLGTGTQGMFGIEESYNEYLTGINGREYGYLNSDSELERTVKEPVNGNTVVSTIDINTQQIVEKYIQKFNEDHKNEAREGNGAENIGVIIANPNNGEIYAMASSPDFDLNNPKEIDGLEGMDDEKAMEAMNSRWKNFCIAENYEPGSTAKPFTVAAGIESGKMTGEETYYCDGVQTVGGHNIKCVNRSGHGTETVALAISNSCNDALMQMASVIEVDEFCKYQSIFNIGYKTGVDLPGEESGLIYTAENMGPTDLACNSFGQNFNVNMVQMVAGFSSLINGGYYYQPHVVKKITSANGGTVETMDSKLIRQTVSAATSEKMRSYLFETVQNGTGRSAKVPGYSMGGKTGTAERVGRDKKNYLISFIGYAPAEKPQVVVYVVIDRPNIYPQSQSKYATTLAKDIMTEVLPYMNIFPDQEYTTEELEAMAEQNNENQTAGEGGSAITNGEEQTGTDGENQTTTNGEEQTGADGENQTTTNGEEQTGTGGGNQTTVNGENQTAANGENPTGQQGETTENNSENQEGTENNETTNGDTTSEENDPYYDPETGDNLDPNFSYTEETTSEDSGENSTEESRIQDSTENNN
ncbi:MAG: peptidoglycan glycosyltransferase [Lachnospiraceae bacterium]|nr:peptidoglycan glycosyltransferase [Lachnospiraceae bacterium]